MPLVKNAKLELPVGSNEPLSPQHFHFQDHTGGTTTAILLLINIPTSKAHTFMTLTMIMTIISITTHSNTRVMRNTPVTIMKEILMDPLNTTMRTMLVSTKKRVKVSYVKKMSPVHSLMMVWNNDMRTGLSKST